MKIDSWKIWKEEFDRLCELQMEQGDKIDKETARRFFIFTEGFMHKVFSTGDVNPQNMEILKQIREKNLLMLSKEDRKRLGIE